MTTDSTAPRPRYRTPAELALSIGGNGDRLETLCPSLNLATRGGIRTGRVVAVGGAPGAGKTTLVVQQAVEWARAHVPVTILASDEEPEGLLIRVGQILGLDREDLEDGRPAARGALAARLNLEVPSLMILDADENIGVEDAAAELVERCILGEPSVLIVDSIQTVKSALSVAAEGPRARIDAVVAALKVAAKANGHLVVATSELARGAYRKTDDRIEGLAAFKESGGIEYGVAVGLVMRSVPGEGGFVDVEVVKNRLGAGKPTFRLHLDVQRAAYVEVERVEDTGEEGAVHRAEQMAGIRKKVVAVVKANVEPLRSANAIAERVKGRKKDVLAAVRELEEEGVIAKIGGSYKVPTEATVREPIEVVPKTGSRPKGRGTGNQFLGAAVPEPVPEREPGGVS